MPFSAESGDAILFSGSNRRRAVLVDTAVGGSRVAFHPPLHGRQVPQLQTDRIETVPGCKALK